MRLLNHSNRRLIGTSLNHVETKCQQSYNSLNYRTGYLSIHLSYFGSQKRKTTRENLEIACESYRSQFELFISFDVANLSWSRIDRLVILRTDQRNILLLKKVNVIFLRRC